MRYPRPPTASRPRLEAPPPTTTRLRPGLAAQTRHPLATGRRWAASRARPRRHGDARRPRPRPRPFRPHLCGAAMAAGAMRTRSLRRGFPALGVLLLHGECGARGAALPLPGAGLWQVPSPAPPPRCVQRGAHGHPSQPRRACLPGRGRGAELHLPLLRAPHREADGGLDVPAPGGRWPRNGKCPRAPELPALRADGGARRPAGRQRRQGLAARRRRRSAPRARTEQCHRCGGLDPRQARPPATGAGATAACAPWQALTATDGPYRLTGLTRDC